LKGDLQEAFLFKFEQWAEKKGIRKERKRERSREITHI
jgi:hypothetical protein